MTWSPYAIPGVVSTLLLVGLLPMVWSRRSAPGALAFLWMIAMLALWAALQAAAAIFDSFDAKYLIARLQYTPISLSPLAFFVFAVTYSGWSSLFRRPLGYLLPLIPVISSLLALTNPLHSMLWTEVTFNGADLPIQTPSYGNWFFVHLVFGYLLILGSIILIGLTFRRSRHQRGQTVLLVAAPAIVAGVNILYLARSTPLQPLDPTPSAFAVSIALVGLALFRYRLFDLVPIARRAMVDQHPDAVVVLDTLDRIVDLNPSALKLLDLDSEEALGALAVEAFPPSLVTLVAASSLRSFAEVRLGEPGGERTYDAKLMPLEGDGGLAAGRLLVVQDVTERTREAQKLRELEKELRRANASLEQRANVDSLTGLLRRENFLERLEEEFARSRRYDLELSLLVVDVDRFKAVNDGYGHRVGDQVLAAIAHVMAGQKRQTDFAGRLGGDEFGMLLTGTDLVGAGEVADRLGSRTADLRLPSSAGRELLVTVSIGVVTLDPSCESSQDLLDRADDALYRAKSQGRNRVVAAAVRD